MVVTSTLNRFVLWCIMISAKWNLTCDTCAKYAPQLFMGVHHFGLKPGLAFNQDIFAHLVNAGCHPSTSRGAELSYHQ